MRKALLIIVMIAAAFGGGVVVNGPGPAWLQAGLKAAGRSSGFVRVVSTKEGPSPASDASTPAPAQPKAETVSVATATSEPLSTPESAKPREVPAAPLPPLVLDRPAAVAVVKESARVVASAESPPARPGPSPEPVKTPALDSDAPKPPAPLPTSAVEVPTPSAPMSAAAPLDAPIVSPVTGSDEIQPPQPPRDPAVVQAAKPAEPSNPAVAGSAPSSNEPNDWPTVRRKLREAGVSRFEIDTELAGRTRFRCVIPLAGRRAVGQMFEGEGVDEFQAAESALKRIRLWKISERGGNSP